MLVRALLALGHDIKHYSNPALCDYISGEKYLNLS